MEKAMPPNVYQGWLQKLFHQMEDMPDEVYSNPDSAIKMSTAISLKRIADSLEQIVPILRRPPRT